MKKRLIILLHGFFRTNNDMNFLARNLESFGYSTFCPTLPTTTQSLSVCVQILTDCLEQNMLNEFHCSFVGHSMGGLIIREYLNSINCAENARCVMIASPNKGSALAKMLTMVPGTSKILESVPDLCSRSDHRCYNNLGKIDFGVIAGNKSTPILGKFLNGSNDGRVEVESTKIPNMKDFIELPFHHNEIHHQLETLKFVKNFLEKGHFGVEKSTPKTF
jgi:hypothetical protein